MQKSFSITSTIVYSSELDCPTIGSSQLFTNSNLKLTRKQIESIREQTISFFDKVLASPTGYVEIIKKETDGK